MSLVQIYEKRDGRLFVLTGEPKRGRGESDLLLKDVQTGDVTYVASKGEAESYVESL